MTTPTPLPMLIACDIDGTLLNLAGELVEANVRALDAARKAGATVVIATARSYAGAVLVHQTLGLDTPLVVNNGTLICLSDGQPLHVERVAPATAREVFARFQKTPHVWAVRQGDVAHLHPDFDRNRAPFNDSRYYRPLAPTDVTTTLGDFEDITTLSLYGDDVASFYHAHDWAALGLRGAFYPPSHYHASQSMSLISDRASKGEGVAWLKRHLGLETARVIAIGDSEADATMFPLGIGVAPANSDPEVLAVADWVAPHCDEGAVAAVVARYVLRAGVSAV